MATCNHLGIKQHSMVRKQGIFHPLMVLEGPWSECLYVTHSHRLVGMEGEWKV